MLTVNYSCKHTDCDFCCKLTAMAAHEKTCVYLPVECPWGDCTYRGCTEDIIEHLQRGHKVKKGNCVDFRVDEEKFVEILPALIATGPKGELVVVVV